MGHERGLDMVYLTLIERCEAVILILAEIDDHKRDVEAMGAGVMDYVVKRRLSAQGLERSMRRSIERKRIETSFQRAAAERTYLAATIANLSVSVLISDPFQHDNPLVFVNPAFTAITGYSKEEVLERNARFLTHSDSDPAILEGIGKAIDERRVFKGITQNRRKDGTLYRSSFVISPVSTRLAP